MKEATKKKLAMIFRIVQIALIIITGVVVFNSISEAAKRCEVAEQRTADLWMRLTRLEFYMQTKEANK